MTENKSCDVCGEMAVPLSFGELLSGKRVLLAAVKGRDYIRVRQLIRIAEGQAAEVRVLDAEGANPFLRAQKLKRELAGHFKDIDDYDVILATFLPQLIVPWLKKRLERAGWHGVLISDFFISLYDTICLDRRLVHTRGIPGQKLRRMDTRTLALSDRILTDTKSDAVWFARTFGADPAKFETLYLEADREIYHPGASGRRVTSGVKATESISAEEHCRSGNCESTSMGNPDRSALYRVLYFGTGLKLQGIDVLLDAIRMVRERAGRDAAIGDTAAGVGRTSATEASIEFTLVGLSRRQQKEAVAIPGCHVIPWLPQKELAALIDESDLCLAGHFAKDNDKARRVIPGKAFIYESMEKEMILGDGPGNREIFREDDRHHYVPMGDARALAEKILTCREKRRAFLEAAAATQSEMNPLISVILPVYNNGDDLKRCMEGLLAQSYPAERTEILLVDDGSTDGTGKLCDAYAAENEHIRIIHQANAGAPAARNTGLAEAKGTWVAFVDPDDLVDPEYLAAPCRAGEETGADLVFFDGVRKVPETGEEAAFVYMQKDHAYVAQAQATGAPGGTVTKGPNTAGLYLLTEPQELLTLACRTLYDCTGHGSFPYPFAAPWNKLYRRSFLTENSLKFPAELKVLDDMAFLFEVFAKARRVCYLPEKLYTYVYHKGTVSTKYRPERAALDLEVFSFLQDRIRTYSAEGRIDAGGEKRMTETLYARIVKSYTISLKSSFFAPDNPAPPAQQKKAAAEALDKPLRSEAFAKVPLSLLEGRLKIVAVAGRLRAAGFLRLLAKLQTRRELNAKRFA